MEEAQQWKQFLFSNLENKLSVNSRSEGDYHSNEAKQWSETGYAYYTWKGFRLSAILSQDASYLAQIELGCNVSGSLWRQPCGYINTAPCSQNNPASFHSYSWVETFLLSFQYPVSQHCVVRGSWIAVVLSSVCWFYTFTASSLIEALA